MHQAIVSGVTVNSTEGPIPIRREIHDLLQDHKQFSLYIQALRRFQDTKQDDLLSFFSIAGIHGLPYESWDGATGESSQKAGYCTHGSNLFPTWHRVYLALYEQELQRHAAEIAEGYKEDVEAWRDAASALRSPYWDWARYKIPPDEVIRLETLRIETSNGIVSIENPLYAYTFKPIDPSFRDHYAAAPKTVRNQEPKESTISRPDALAESFRNYDARAAVFKMLTLLTKWTNFSNHTYSKRKGAVANSLEEIHDCVHDLIGGSGHMGDLAYAAFDPLFWLHHTNVDRLFALWQTINYDVWVTAEREKIQTYTIPSNSMISEDTDLTPFWNGEKTFWRSADDAIKDWTKLNYDYPEFADMKDKTKDDRRSAVLETVVSLYGPSSARFDSDEAMTPIAISGRIISSLVPNTDLIMNDWFIRIRSGRFALGQSYTVLLFLGEPPVNKFEWRSSSQLLGIHAVLVSSRASMCGNCLAQQGNVDEGIVHMTDRLESLGLLSQQEGELENFLRYNLHWRIQKADGDVVKAENVAHLEVAIMTVPLRWSVEDRIYVVPPGTHPMHRNLTCHRPGGRRCSHKFLGCSCSLEKDGYPKNASCLESDLMKYPVTQPSKL